MNCIGIERSQNNVSTAEKTDQNINRVKDIREARQSDDRGMI